jgi:hypothetical protein
MESMGEAIQKEFDALQQRFDMRLKEYHVEATARARTPAEARIGSSRTQRRNQQRKGKSGICNVKLLELRQQKGRLSYTPDKLLGLRPPRPPTLKDATAQMAIGTAAFSSIEDIGLSVEQRLQNLEIVCTSSVFCRFEENGENGIEWGPWQSAVPAGVLARECAAVKFLQRAWRRSNQFKKDSIWKPVFVNHCGSCHGILLSGCASSSPHLCGLCNAAACLHHLSYSPVQPSRRSGERYDLEATSADKLDAPKLFFLNPDDFAVVRCCSRKHLEIVDEASRRLGEWAERHRKPGDPAYGNM